MRKKVKFKIPKDQKIKLEDISNDEDYETLDNYEQEKLYFKSSIPLSTKYPRQKNKKSIISSIGSTIAVLIFLVITILIITSIATKISFKDNKKPQEEIKLTTHINGSWQSSHNGLFVFNKDNSFYWYNSFDNLKDNYYRGTYNYKTGNDALNEMGYTEEEFKKEFGSDVKLENIYSINLKPNYVFMSGIDITSVELNENETWWYLLIIKEDNTAYGYNKTLDLKYNLIKKAD